MNLLKTLVASAALATSFGVSAQVTGALGAGAPDFLSLSLSDPAPCAPCTLGPGVATIAGGTTYSADLPFADIPAGGVFEGRFLAAGPTPSDPSTMTFTTPVDYISFLWGSPDTYNTLTVNYLMGAVPGFTSFTAAGLGFAVTNGNQSFSQYVQFFAAAGTVITSLVFHSTQNAFETANFSVTPIPEPETYALMLAGLGALGFVGRRRRKS